MEKKPGTIVKEVTNVEKLLIKGVAKDDRVARLSILGVKDVPGVAFKIFSSLAARNINVDIILQTVARENSQDVTFTVAKTQMEEALAVLNEVKQILGASGTYCDDNITKVSIVGAGMANHPGVAARMFEALADANINIQMISTSEIKISVLIDKENGERAVNAIHEAFAV